MYKQGDSCGSVTGSTAYRRRLLITFPPDLADVPFCLVLLKSPSARFGGKAHTHTHTHTHNTRQAAWCCSSLPRVTPHTPTGVANAHLVYSFILSEPRARRLYRAPPVAAAAAAGRPRQQSRPCSPCPQCPPVNDPRHTPALLHARYYTHATPSVVKRVRR